MAGNSQPTGMVPEVPKDVERAALFAVKAHNTAKDKHYKLEHVVHYWPKTAADNYYVVIQVSDPDSDTSPVFGVKVYEDAISPSAHGNLHLKEFTLVFDQIV